MHRLHVLGAPRSGIWTMHDSMCMQVHRHHPPLVYGRSMTAEPEQSEGAAVCRVVSGPGGLPVYAAITYQCACHADRTGQGMASLLLRHGVLIREFILHAGCRMCQRAWCSC